MIKIASRTRPSAPPPPPEFNSSTHLSMTPSPSPNKPLQSPANPFKTLGTCGAVTIPRIQPLRLPEVQTRLAWLVHVRYLPSSYCERYLPTSLRYCRIGETQSVKPHHDGIITGTPIIYHIYTPSYNMPRPTKPKHTRQGRPSTLHNLAQLSQLCQILEELSSRHRYKNRCQHASPQECG